MAIQGFFTGDVKIRDLNGVLKAVDGIVEVATDAGTVTSVGLTVGSTGTDVNVANSPVTTSGNITLNLPTASATNRGLLSSADWAIFDAKQGSITLTTTGNNGSATLTSGTLNIPTYTLAGLGGISLTSLSASSPLAYNNTTGAFSIQVANGSQGGYLSSSDWTTFNSKQSALTFSSPLVNTAGTVSIPAATSSVNGYLTSTDWTTFNAKQGAITLTTTGSSGAATLIGTTLNIPNYSGGLTGYVPYTGATTNVDLGEYEIKAGQFTLDVSPTGTAAVGTTRWNNTIGSSETTLKGGSVILKNGVDLVARVVNKVTPNTTLTKATYPAVRVSGAAGQRLAVAYAQANNDNNSADTIGLVTETIATNQEGFIMTVGQLLDINTTGSLQGETWADGDVLYLSPTTPGALTNVKPTGATGHIVVMGYVEYAHANHGSIYVKIMNGWELDELHNVYISSPVNNQGLFYESATSLWKNKSIATVLGYTPANAATTITINGTTYDISANRTWNVGTVTSVGTSGPLTGGTITGSGTIGITQATTSTDGYLSSTDWNTFYNKQAAGSYITALTGEATATGPGSATVTLSTSAVTGKLLTGLNLTGGGSIAATDSILQAFGKVQNQISGLAGGVTYQGTWNASTNTPTLTSSVGTKGYYYIVDVAGSTNLNGITDWKIGDWAIFNGTTWDKVDNTDAVSSVNGFTGAVSLTTSNIAEGTNLYYLDSRARLALSFTAGSGAYDNTTGVITIPTNTSQLTNGANFITLSSLSASSPLSYNSGTGAFSIQVANGSQNGYLSSSDWTTFNSKQNAITLTTTGSSGSSTLVGATLNVPTYTLSGLGGVPTTRQLTINGTAYDLSADRSWSVGTHTGSLTSGYIPKANGTTSLTDSLVYDTGTAVLIGTTTASTSKFMVYSTTADNHYQAIGSAPSFRFADTITSPTYTGIVGLATASNHFIIGAAAGDMVLANNTTSSIGNFIFGTGTTERMRITPTGNVSINNTNNTYRFDVNGTVRFTGQLRLESTITDGTYTYTLPSATGTLALTSSIPANPVGGTGTTNYLPKFTGTSTIGNSAITDDGSTIALLSRALSVSGASTLTGRVQGTEIGVTRNGADTIGDGPWFRWTNAAQDRQMLTQLNASNGLTTWAFNGSAWTSLLTLTQSGNLGLGVTPSAWNAGGKAIEIGMVGSAHWGLDQTSTYRTTNAYWNSGWKYGGTGQAANYAQEAGNHYWSTAPSGTAGNAISFTQAMTLNASGNLSIGNTNDTYKLDVSGTGRFTGSVTANELRLTGPAAIANITTGGYLALYGNTAGLYLGGFNAGANQNYQFINASTGVSTFTVSGNNTRLANFSTVTYGSARGLRINSYISSDGGEDCAIEFDSGVAGYGGFKLSNSGTAMLTIASTGAATFSSSVSATGGLISNGGSIGYGGGELGFGVTTSGATSAIYTLAVDSPVLYFDHRATGNTGLWVWRNGSGAGSERMRLTAAGNLGIGTTSPTSKLQITSTSAGAATVAAFLVNESVTTNTEVRLAFAANTNNDISTNRYSYISALNTSGSNGQALLFATNETGNSAVERMRITSGGNVEINTGSIKTGAPSGGTAQPWKLGTVYTGTCVPNSFGDFTSWFTGTVIEIEVNGTTYKIPAVIDNYC
jgi:predicted heme/steroid binding protein